MSPLKVFNTLTAEKEDFVPLNGKQVKMYACGPTVYDLCHLGHARMAITFDIIVRYLRFAGYDVIFVRNITDVDDKIIKRAHERGMRPEQLAREYTYTFWKDMHVLNVISPDFEPRCTEYIGQMVEFIKQLIAGNHAYQSGSDVYFDVSSFKEYGKLKKQSLDDLLVGARDQVRSQEDLKDVKRNPVDFALWKGAASGEPGWDSPWGNGRPGWHLECSTMIKHVLGETIDIHGGGEDLVFPHHENEIAQSEALHSKPFVRYWLHNSFVQVDAEKMSKSLCNFRTIEEVLQTYSPDTIRMFLLQTHYRSPIEFTAENMNAAKSAMARLIRAARLDESTNHVDVQKLIDSHEELRAFDADFRDAMNNDFNTPIAVSVLFALADKVFQAPQDPQSTRPFAQALKHFASVLGFTLEDTSRQIDNSTAESVLELVLQLRESARTNKDYATSDLIRNSLQNLGIKVMDVKGGPVTWERS
jgi:cysteinyl-tRNA synthetase